MPDGVTTDRVRHLTMQDLGLKFTGEAAVAPALRSVDPEPADDAIVARVREAIDLGFAGVILSGPPGTGKSWYAKQIAEVLAGDDDAVRTVQFHTSYQYEDFMQGFAPNDTGGFGLTSKIFPLICEDARERPDVQHVLVIDEISRCDVARVFGEALTYLERDKRGQSFTLASGAELVVPPNLIILATMNPWDKGVDELDVALERRFAQVDMPPSVDTLRRLLLKEGADEAHVDRVAAFFEHVQGVENELCHLGHAYFLSCDKPERARLTWDLRLHSFFRKACRLDPRTLATIEERWAEVAPPAAGGGA